MSGLLKPCPFCGGEAEIVHIEEGDNAGGSCVCCTQCMASGNVEFGRKENFVANWNRRSVQESVPEGWQLVPTRMDAAMINAWSNGPSVTSDEIAYRTPFQDGWKRVLAAASLPIQKERIE